MTEASEAEKIQATCYQHAADLIEGAERLLAPPPKPHLSYHLALLALEEIGKAGLVASRAAIGLVREEAGMEKWLGSHPLKLLWALWTPSGEIDPAHFTEAKQLAEKLHASRKAGLYVDPMADGPPPADSVSQGEAQSIIDYAKVLLRQGPRISSVESPPESNELLEWFLRTVEDRDAMRMLVSPEFLAKYDEMGRNAPRWMEWVRGEFARRAAEGEEMVRVELMRKPGKRGKPRWKVRTRVFTPSHAIRPKTLKYWNERIDIPKLIYANKKDEFILELNLDDNVTLANLYGHALSLTKMLLSFLSIGSIGYFWFERPDFTRQVFEEVRDLEKPGFKLEVQPKYTFWDTDRAPALSEQHLQHAVECMAAFLPLRDQEAEPIFGPYFQGLALLAKSDVHVSTEMTVKNAFIASLCGAIRHFGGWDGQQASLAETLDRLFTPIIPDDNHRKQVLAALHPPIPSGPISPATITTKQLVDLYLIRTARDIWLNSARNSKPAESTADAQPARNASGTMSNQARD